MVTLEQVKHHVGDPFNIRWMKVAAFSPHAGMNCVDGRDEAGLYCVDSIECILTVVIGTPGGDAGEFLILLCAAELLCGQEFTRKEVYQLLQRHMDTFGKFYLQFCILCKVFQGIFVDNTKHSLRVS